MALQRIGTLMRGRAARRSRPLQPRWIGPGLTPDLARAHILVVDDVEADLSLLRDTLRSAGFADVVFMRDSSEVVRQFEESPPDLLVLDLIMPAPDGFELMRRLTRWTDGESYIPVLVVTSDTSQAAKLRALELGARDFLAKPLDPIEVVLRIRNLLTTRKLQVSLQRHAVALGQRVREGERRLHHARDAEAADLQQADLVEELTDALDRDELCLHYQPIATVRERTVLGVEALLRWKHPRHGLTGPGDFLPAVDGTDLGWRVDLTALEQAIAQAAEWQNRGRPLNIAVNVTAATLSDTRLPREFSRLVNAHELDPALVGLEVTESAVMKDPMTAAAVLHQLLDAGLGSVALDDFGTGYSSLARLLELPFERLKIDRAFVAGMQASGTTVIRATIALGESLGMTVVAEGIETAASWRKLRDLGCCAFQGYWLARPQPPEELMDWLAAEAPARGRQPAAEHGSLQRARLGEHRAELRNDYFHAAFDALTEVVLIVDDDGHVAECNEAACAFLGLTRERLLQMEMDAFVPPEELPEWDASWEEFVAAGHAAGRQVVKLPDSRRLWVDFTRTAHFVPGYHLSVLRPLPDGPRDQFPLTAA